MSSSPDDQTPDAASGGMPTASAVVGAVTAPGRPYDPPQEFRARDIRPGGVIAGRYKLLQQIGQGGFGVVYLAEQEQPVRRKVAVKLIKLGMDSDQVVARFESERQALALLSHPNVAAVYDAGATDTGRPFFVMEYVPGEPITAFCDRHNYTTRQRLELFIQACEAIQHAHQKAIIHRDVKPSNLLVMLRDDKPLVKVIDFGVAKATAQRLTEHTIFTEHGQLIGTPEYMSPEQAEMNPLDVDTRTDIYSLGVVLYELLAGAVPFDGKTLRKAAFGQIQRIIREQDPPRMSTRLSSLGESAGTVAQHRQTQLASLQRELRGDLEWIPLKALRKDRSQRYRTATELAEDVRNYLENKALKAGPESAFYRTKKLLVRNKGPVAAAAAVLLVLLAGISVSTWQAVRIAAEQRNTLAQKAEADRQRAAALRNEARAYESEHMAQKRLADGLTYAGDAFEQAGEVLNARQSYLQAWAINEKLELPVLRASTGLMLSYRAHPPALITYGGERSAPSPDGHTGAVWHVAISPDGEWIASSGDTTFRIWDLATGRLERVLRIDDSLARCAAFLPDGKRLVTGSGSGRITVWDLETGKAVKSWAAHGSDIMSVAISPDGARLASVGLMDCKLAVWDISTAEEVVSYTRPEDEELAVVVFSPDGKTLALGSTNSKVRLCDATNGNSLAQLFCEVQVTGLSFSPDGRLLAAACWDKKIRIWDVQRRELWCTLSGHKGNVYAVTFSKDGRTLFSGSADATAKAWDVEKEKELATYVGHTGTIRAVAIKPDNSAIVTASTDFSICLWDAGRQTRLNRSEIHGPRELLLTRMSFYQGSEYERAMDWSPDGRLIAVVGEVVRLIDAATCKVVGELPNFGNRPGCLAFSPDGRSIAIAFENRAIALIDVATGKAVRFLSGHVGLVTGVAWGPNGRTLISTSHGRRERRDPGEIKIWDTETGQCLETFKGHEDSVYTVTPSPDGRFLFTGGGDYTLKKWNIATKQVVWSQKAHEHWIICSAVSLDGQTVLTGSWDRTVILWDAQSGKLLRRFRGHTGWVSSVAFSRDPGVILSGAMDGTVRLWDVATEQEVRTIATHDAAVIEAGFSPDRQVVASLSKDGVMKWTDLSDALKHQAFGTKLREARAALERNVTDAQALLTFADWYSFRDLPAKAAEFYAAALATGAPVKRLTLAQTYWRANRHSEAAEEFGNARSANEIPDWYADRAVKATEMRSPLIDRLAERRHVPPAAVNPIVPQLLAAKAEAHILQTKGQLREAADVLRAALALAQQAGRGENEARGDIWLNYARVLIDMKEYLTAEKVLLNSGMIRVGAYGAAQRDMLIRLYLESGEPEKAMAVFQQKMLSAKNAARNSPDQFWRVIAYQAHYARMLANLQYFEDAEAVLTDTYMLAEAEQHEAIAQQFVDLYVAWKRPAQAAKWRATVAELTSTTAPATAPARPATQPAPVPR